MGGVEIYPLGAYAPRMVARSLHRMNTQLIQAVAQSRQQDLLRGAQQRRLVGELPRRPSPLARFMSAIPSLGFGRRRPVELQHTAPAVSDAS